jgi:hypothetical protein
MTQPSGGGQAERVAPMSGMSRAGLLDEMGRSGPTRQSGTAAGTRSAATGYTPPSRRESQQAIMPASSARPERSQDVNAISNYNTAQGAVLVTNRSGIRQIRDLQGKTICFPFPADQAEASRFLGGRSIGFSALTSDGPPSFMVGMLMRGECAAIYVSRESQQRLADTAMPDVIVLTQ